MKLFCKYRAPSALLVALALVALFGLTSRASDHEDSPLAAADPAADLADLYAWHSAVSNSLTAIITFDGFNLPAADQSGTYDSDVLYTLHIDNTDDEIADIEVNIRFGQNDADEWGVQVENLPGAPGTVVGPVEQVIGGGSGTQVYAGLRDDPFFFDSEGLAASLDTGGLGFDDDRDGFAGRNATAIALRMGLSQALDGSDELSIWATSARIGGGDA